MSLELTRRELNQFASEQRDACLAFLQKYFSIPEEDCKDIFQESFIQFYNSINEGKFRRECSLSTYFKGICRYKALEFIRSRNRHVTIADEESISLMDGNINFKKVDLLIMQEDESVENKKAIVVHQIINDLPPLCEKILWKYCCENLSLDIIAKMVGWKNGSTLKVQKSRCCKKFRERYSRILKDIIDR